MELAAQKRDIVGKKVTDLRKQGTLPAVLYGAKDESTPIAVSRREFEQVFKEAGESTVITLSLDGTEKNVLIHEIDRDPVSHEIRHADFYVVQKGQKVEVGVPIEFVGEAPAVKEHGANVVKVLHELQVKAEATNLPHEIVVDISTLENLDSHIAAKDVKLPAGVELAIDPEEMVVTVAVQEEEPEEPVEAPDMDAIGISEERGKKEEEGGDDATESGGDKPEEKKEGE